MTATWRPDRAALCLNEAGRLGVDRVRGLTTLHVAPPELLRGSVNHAEFLKRASSGVYMGHRVLVHPPPRGSLALVSSALKGLATDPDTVVTLALPREWREEFTDVARADAFPISCFHDLPGCGFVGDHHFAVTTEPVDVWLWENPAGRMWNASSMYLLKRRLRKELAEHCRTRYKGEPYDGGARGLNFADVRRGMTHYERNMRHPRRPPTTGDPAKLAAGDPHRDVYVEPGTLPLDYASAVYSPDELLHGRPEARRSRLLRDPDLLQQQLARNEQARRQLQARTLACGYKLPARETERMHRQGYFQVSDETRSLVPEATWHLEDTSPEQHAARCAVDSAADITRVTIGFASRAAACAAVAAEDSLTDAFKASYIPLETRRLAAEYLQDAHDASPIAYAPIDVKELERLHRYHCGLCRRAKWSPTGRSGVPLPGGCRHHPRCYYAKVHEMFVFGLNMPFIGEVTGDRDRTPQPTASLPYPYPLYGSKVRENLKAVKKGLVKLRTIPYAVRRLHRVRRDVLVATLASGRDDRDQPEWEAQDAEPSAQWPCLAAFDLPLEVCVGDDGVERSKWYMQYNCAFRNRELWLYRIDPTTTPKPRITSGLHRNYNEHLCVPDMAYEGHDAIQNAVSPGMVAALSDASAFFTHVPLARKRRHCQVYHDLVDGEFRVLVNLGFGGAANPFYASQLSTELAHAQRGKAELARRRFERLCAERGFAGLCPPDCVRWLEEDGFVVVYIDDFINGGRRFRDWEGNDHDTARDAQYHLNDDALRIRLMMSPDKECPSSHTQVILGLEYQLAHLDEYRGRPRLGVMVVMPMARREQLSAQLRLVLKGETISIEDLRSLTGTAMWVSHVMRGANAYLADTYEFLAYYERRLEQAIASQQRMPPLAVSPSVRAEMDWFIRRLHPGSGWKGSRHIDLSNAHVIMVRSDAAGEDGWGWMVLPTGPCRPEDVEYGTGKWSREEEQWPSFTKELKAAVLGVLARAPSCPGDTFMIIVDNSGVAFALNSGRAHDPRAKALMRELADACVELDLDVIGRFVDRDNNVTCDLLSRQQTLLAAWAEDCKLSGEDPRVVRRRAPLRDERHNQFNDVLVFDLFCGVLGFSQGAALAPPRKGHRQRVRPVGGVDACPTAVATARRVADHKVFCRNIISDEMLREQRGSSLLEDAIENPDKVRWARQDVVDLVTASGAHGVLGSPPCQAFTTMTLTNAKDRKDFASADYSMGVVDVVLRTGAYFFVIENVPAFVRSPQWATAVKLLGTSPFRWHVQHVITRLNHIGGCQTRSRVLIFGTRVGPIPIRSFYEQYVARVCMERGLQPGAGLTVHQYLPHFPRYIYRHPLKRSRPMILDTHLRPHPTLLTSCLQRPSRDAQGLLMEPPLRARRPPTAIAHPRDTKGRLPLTVDALGPKPPKGWTTGDAPAHLRDPSTGQPIDNFELLTPSMAGQLAGFPEDFPWPSMDLRCRCPICWGGPATGPPPDFAVPPAGRMIGNCVPIELGQFAGAAILELIAPLIAKEEARQATRRSATSSRLAPSDPTE